MNRIAFCMFLVACGGDGGADTPPTDPRLHTVTIDAVEREYVVHVPDGLVGPAPVVFMIHGTSGDGMKFYNISGWVEKADAEGLIAIFPSALTYCLGDDDNRDGAITPDEYRVTTKWAAGALGTPTMPLCSDEQVAQLPAEKRDVVARTVHDDVAFFDAMVDAAIELGGDPQRLYVTGFSNGAQMSARLMIERTNTFAAFAMMAGGPAVAGTALRAAPAVFSVGSKDDGFVERVGLRELPLDATLFDLPEIDGFVADLCTRISIDPAARTSTTVTVAGTPIGRHHYTGASNELIVAVIDEATHQYPNGTNHPVVMADLLWEFFAKYTL